MLSREETSPGHGTVQGPVEWAEVQGRVLRLMVGGSVRQGN